MCCTTEWAYRFVGYPTVLRALTGVELSQSAITQDALRRAQGAVGRCVPEAAGVGA